MTSEILFDSTSAPCCKTHRFDHCCRFALFVQSTGATRGAKLTVRALAPTGQGHYLKLLEREIVPAVGDHNYEQSAPEMEATGLKGRLKRWLSSGNRERRLRGGILPLDSEGNAILPFESVCGDLRFELEPQDGTWTLSIAGH
jgi:hypothetical protein